MKDSHFKMRLSASERKLIDALAQREERTASDIVRRIIRKEAERCGITSMSRVAGERGAGQPGCVDKKEDCSRV